MPQIACKIVEMCIFKFEHDRAWYLLLHRMPDEQIYPNIWQFVSGSIEGEERALDAALREMAEETSIPPKAVWVAPHVNVFYDAGWDALNFSPVFAAQVEIGSTPKLSLEHDKFGWYPYEEAMKMLVWPGQREGLRIVHEYIVGGQKAGELTRVR